MKKDAYYFPHFSNARNDSKLIKLRRVLGIEGYGLYFMLLEVLREQTDFRFPISGIEDLAYEWHISKEKIASVIKDFDLFIIVDIEFFSPKLIYYLQPYLEKSERARKAALTRWNNANALQMHNKSNASKVKESKVKESKVNKSKKKIYSDEIKNFTASLTNYFSKNIIDKLTNSQKFKWIDTIDKLIRLDKYSKEEIKLAVENATTDNFWKSNFYSLTKLRTKNEKQDCKHIVIFLGLNKSNGQAQSSTEERKRILREKLENSQNERN